MKTNDGQLTRRGFSKRQRADKQGAANKTSIFRRLPVLSYHAVTSDPWLERTEPECNLISSSEESLLPEPSFFRQMTFLRGML